MAQWYKLDDIDIMEFERQLKRQQVEEEEEE